MNSLALKTLRFLLTTIILCLCLCLGALSAFAQKVYQPIVGIPGVQANSDLPTYLNTIYLMLIGLGAIVGVIKIAIAGVKYSLSDIVTDKSEAKKDIYGVLLGLGILLIPFIVLKTINPNLTSLDVLSGHTKTSLSSTPSEINPPPITPTEFVNKAGDYTTSGYHLGVSTKQVSPEELVAFRKMCAELDPAATLHIDTIKNGTLTSYGYSCSK